MILAVTQNLWGGAAAWSARRDVLVRRLDELRPDLIALQEVHCARDDPGDTQAHEVAAALGGYDTHFAPGRVEEGHCEGVALLARRGLRAPLVERLSLDPYDPLEGRSQRVVLHAILDVEEGAALDVFVTHLSLSRRARARTVEEVLAFVERVRNGSERRGAVLMGDLNATPGESIHARLGTRWIDAWQAANGARGGGTWPAPLPLLRYDYVYVEGPVAVEESFRLPFAGSDHRGVAARLRLR